MKELLKALTAIPGPGGGEEEVSSWIKNRLQMLNLKILKDIQGNLIITHNKPQKILLALVAHMDEVFSVVRNIDENGFLKIQLSPGLSPRDLYGQRVLVKCKRGWISGKVGSFPNHLTKAEEERTVPLRTAFYVDIGCRSKSEVNAYGVRVGSAVVFERTFFENNGYVFATALDDRGGISIIMNMLEQCGLPPHVAVIFSVQEEFLLRGGLAAIRTVAPHVAVIVDGMLSFDTPDLIEQCPVALGNGPVLATYTFHGKGEAIGVVQKHQVVDFILELAKQNSINLQLGVYEGLVTEGAFTQFDKQGILAIELGFPLRYAHSSVECCHLSDLDYLRNLLTIIIQKEVLESLGRLL